MIKYLILNLFTKYYQYYW